MSTRAAQFSDVPGVTINSSPIHRFLVASKQLTIDPSGIYRWQRE